MGLGPGRGGPWVWGWGRVGRGPRVWGAGRKGANRMGGGGA